MKLKKLIILLLIIVIILLALFGYFYILKKSPTDSIKGIAKLSIDLSKPPNFLYAINTEMEHQLDFPAAVFVANNKIYVSDVSKDSVGVYDYNGKLITDLKPGQGTFTDPYGIASDGSNIYIADPSARKIYIFGPGNDYKGIFAVKGVELIGPGSLMFKDGKLYVSDQPMGKVLVFDIDGNLVKTYAQDGHDSGQLYFPHGLAMDDKGLLYVADAGNDRIEVFNPDGTVARIFQGEIMTPRGLQFDSRGNLWVVSGLAHKLQVYRTDGSKITEFGIYGSEYGQIMLPNGLFIDQNNRIYVTEVGNSRVSVFGY